MCVCMYKTTVSRTLATVICSFICWCKSIIYKGMNVFIYVYIYTHTQTQTQTYTVRHKDTQTPYQINEPRSIYTYTQTYIYTQIH